jgi:hypothetical protein
MPDPIDRDDCADLPDADSPTLDRTALLSEGLTDAEIEAVMMGSSAISQTELHDRLALLRRGRVGQGGQS